MNRLNTSDIKGNTLHLYLFGDQHIGYKYCDINLIKKDITIIKKDPKAKVILMGDMCDIGLKNSVGAGCFDNDINPEEQIDLAIELLRPIKNKIVGIHSGNHSERIKKETTLSPEKMIVNSLNVSYLGDTVFNHIRFKDQTYILFTAHGNSDSATITGALNRCMKYSDYVTMATSILMQVQ